MKSRKSSPGLPPHVDPLDPRTIKWRQDQLEVQFGDMREELDMMKNQPTALDLVERLPWKRVLIPLLIVIALKAGWIGADIANSLLGR